LLSTGLYEGARPYGTVFGTGSSKALAAPMSPGSDGTHETANGTATRRARWRGLI